MGTSSRSVGRRTPKSQVAARSHRGLDIGGIICITLGIVVLIALAVGGAGAVGEARAQHRHVLGEASAHRRRRGRSARGHSGREVDLREGCA